MYRSGVIALSHPDDAYGKAFVSTAYENCRNFGIDAKQIKGSSDTKKYFPAEVTTGEFGEREGYKNPIGGWAEAGRATAVGIKRIREGGASVRGGCEVVGLIKEGRKVGGVILKGGEKVMADLVVVSDPRRYFVPSLQVQVCAGAWYVHFLLTFRRSFS